MSKIRVYELAKMLDKSNSELVEILTGFGVEVKSHMSSIDTEVAQLVEESLNEKGTAAGEKDKRSAEINTETVNVASTASLSDLAVLIGESPAAVVKILINAGFMVPASSRVDEKTLQLVGAAFKKHLVLVNEEENKEREGTQASAVPSKKLKAKGDTPLNSDSLKLRPPIVTVMGHVDHGKTTLLDFIRKTHVTEREAGGITQHIGAYKVRYGSNDIVFLDTPGHEAFTAMRARGASVTDIAILVVAADDGVKPQTVEALNHAKAAGVPIVVAVTKSDKPDSKPERVRQQLSDHGLAPEEWGGDTVMVDVSARTGDGIEQLLEMVLLVAEMNELKADPTAQAEGIVVEANLDKGKGPVATVIVTQGTLRKGNIISTGSTWGKIRAMLDDSGKILSEAGPSTPVEILGFESVPIPGEAFSLFNTEREAREIAGRNSDDRRAAEGLKDRKLSLEELYEKMQEEEKPLLNIVLKCDVQGSLEAFISSIMKKSTEEVGINIVHSGVGRISESDVMLASVSSAIIIGFNVRPDANAKKISENTGVQIRLYSVIYEMLDDLKAALEGLLAPVLREHVLGQAEIRASFGVPKIGRIAGCYVQEGMIKRNAKTRLIRDGIVIWEGLLSSLKHFKEDIREIASGNECGLSFSSFQDFREGDIIESFEILKEKQTLE